METQTQPYTWMVGVGLGERDDHAAPMHMASWLSRNFNGPPLRVVGVHVMEAPLYANDKLHEETRAKLQSALEASAAEALRRTGLEVDPEVIMPSGEEVAEALAQASADQNAFALIVGRRARRDDDAVVRLGGHTRRLLRMLARPVMVVPADLDENGPGEGPVIIATDLSEGAIEAFRAASQLATGLRRELLVALAIPQMTWADGFIDTVKEVRERMEDESLRRGHEALEQWADEHGIEPRRLVTVSGDPVTAIHGLAEREDAAAIVTGTRGLSMLGRVFLGSVSGELAAVARRPVMIVPGRPEQD